MSKAPLFFHYYYISAYSNATFRRIHRMCSSMCPYDCENVSSKMIDMSRWHRDTWKVYVRTHFLPIEKVWKIAILRTIWRHNHSSDCPELHIDMGKYTWAIISLELVWSINQKGKDLFCAYQPYSLTIRSSFCFRIHKWLNSVHMVLRV